MNDILRSSIECCQQVHEPFKGAIFGALFAEGRQIDNALKVSNDCRYNHRTYVLAELCDLYRIYLSAFNVRSGHFQVLLGLSLAFFIFCSRKGLSLFHRFCHGCT